MKHIEQEELDQGSRSAQKFETDRSNNTRRSLAMVRMNRSGRSSAKAEQ